LQSATYQRSSQTVPENAEEGRFYSHYYPRRLMAEVLLDALSQVTDVPTDFSKTVDNDGFLHDRPYPAGYRALQLPDPNVASYFLKTFGRNERMITCECERSDEPSMVQVLHISNGSTLDDKLRSPGNRIEQMLSQGLSDREILENLMLSALARFPTEEEALQMLAVVAESAPPGASAESRREVWEDVAWSILSSREFLFNH
jgi:hypothetical protein